MTLPDFDSVRALVIGDVMLDKYIIGKTTRISPEAPTQIIKPEERTYTAGGAANVAVNLASLGCETTLIGVVNNDTYRFTLTDILNENGVSTNFIIEDDRPTTVKTRIISQGKQLLRLDDEMISPVTTRTISTIKGMITVSLPKIDVVILSDYNKGMFLNGLAESIIDSAKISAHKIPVFVDPKGLDWSRYHGATCITPNINELTAVGGLQGVNHLDLGYVLVTRGQDGMTLISKDGETHIPTKAKTVYDVSGAGDTVIATLAGTFGAGYSMVQSTNIANIAAGIVVGMVGTSPITKTLLEQEMKHIG